MAKYVIDNAPSPIDFQQKDSILRTVQNAKNLLMCKMGEVPYDRFRGFNTDLYDLPMNEFNTELLPELDRIMIYEPDVNVIEASAKMLPDGSVYISATIDVAIKENGEKE